MQTRKPRWPEQIERWAEGVADSLYWKARDKEASAAPEHVSGAVIGERFSVEENGARFAIDFAAGYSPGIFLDQRENRARVREASGPGSRVLNAFAYTGAFSVMAALAGAETTTLDLSRAYLDWTWENFGLNGLDPADHHGCKGDAFQWMRSFSRQGRTFHGVVLDPPTFSRAGKKTFRTDRDYASLAESAARLVEAGGWMLCCANTHRLAAADFERQVREGVDAAGKGIVSLRRHPMPPEFRGDEYLKTLWLVVE